MKLRLEQPFPWQEPVITEKECYECLKNDPIKADVTFLSVPWAPIIDHKNFGLPKNKSKAEKFLRDLRKLRIENSFTVCQSYRFKEITPYLRRAGIKVLFTPHATHDAPYSEGIKIESLPLFAANAVDPAEKDILYSFMGAYSDKYISTIREKIFDDHHPDHTVVIYRKKWQFNDAVYGEQLRGIETNSVQSYISEEHCRFYKNILARSRFSPCPSGMGPASIRFFESLRAGAIPILLADTWRLPSVKGVDWEKCTLKIPESEYNTMQDTLQSITPEQEDQMRSLCIKAYQQVSKKNFVKCIRNYYGE
tara:strand:- start:49 stop:972 length:924 start_codon:yes stop_codon:yes gene_type:complete